MTTTAILPRDISGTGEDCKITAKSQADSSPRLEGQINSIRDWLASGEPNPVLELSGVSFDEAQALEELFTAEGRKLRFNWYSETRTLYLTMALFLHEVMTQTLSDQLTYLQNKTEGLSIEGCISPELFLSGSHRCKLVGRSRPSYLVADQGITILDRKTNSYPFKRPAVVFEIALSQTLQKVLLKAVKWLWDTDFEVQAVVVYKMSWPISEGQFSAEIGIWTRDSEDIDVTFPLCKCTEVQGPSSTTVSETGSDALQVIIGSNHPEGSVKLQSMSQTHPVDSPQDIPADVESWSGNTSSVEEGSTLVEEDAPVLETGAEIFPTLLSQRRIKLRRGWIKIIDEANPAECENLDVLRFLRFDFLRMCRNDDTTPTNFTIPFSLGRLQTLTTRNLQAHRESIASEEITVPQPPIPASSKKRRQAALPDPNDPPSAPKKSRNAHPAS